MNKQQETNETSELYIEELGEVRGGSELPGAYRPLTLGTIGAEGIDPWIPGQPMPLPKPLPKRDPDVPRTTLALGEEGPLPFIF